MIIVVDTNILFSACIAKEKQNRISEILFSPIIGLERITCAYALTELTLHHEKLIKASKLNNDELAEYLLGYLSTQKFIRKKLLKKCIGLKPID